MKKFILFIVLICISFSSHAQTKKRKKSQTVKFAVSNQIIVSGTITETQQYCGGAPPPQSMLDEYNTPKPVANYKLYIRKVLNDINTPIFKSVETDANGKFQISLEPGKYTVVDERKKDKQTYSDLVKKYKTTTETTGPIDEICLKKYFAEADFEITVLKTAQVVSHNYFRTCNYAGAPCVEFTGAYPQ
jgi:hypothetical protein